ncbi:outer envelope protein 80, chloroplastic-like isoform X1 [Panicum virgatum]|uniref:outer envelope protein 80, chloroplastic-like isoform X1 n=1 Tax=Panicum virgatum TaxID=38727 RepID=UPI0019D6A94D|nr:outer envelope protein 80, chloroplastic-like isoform X1 [Panicum virgatum]
MRRSRDVRFVSSDVKLPSASASASAPARAPAPALLSAALPFAHIGRAIDAAAHRLGACLPRVPVARADTAPPPPVRRHGKDAGGGGEERVLISEVAVRGKDGEPLERPELEAAAAAALRACRPNVALTVREVQEDVHRVVESGLFRSCMPVAVDTRDGIRLVFEVEPNQDFHGLVCEGANMLPSKFLEDAFRDRHGKIINIRHLDQVIKSVNGWYQERGLTGLVSYAEILSGGILRLQVSEAEVNNINIRFLDRKTGEPTVGKTQPETILRQLTTKKGQAYNRAQVKRDVETILTMGIMEDVTIIPQPVGDSNKVDLVMNLVERPSGGFSAGGGISSGITNGPLSGLIGSFAYSHRNVFGRNKKLNLSLERGQIDSIFRLNFTDPWIDGDNKRTSRTVMVQNSRTPGTLVHGGDHPDHGPITIGRVTAGVEYSRPFRPKWSGTLGLIFQHAGARDDKSNPVIRDFYNSQLTARSPFSVSYFLGFHMFRHTINIVVFFPIFITLHCSGNASDDTLLAKFESIYTDSGDHSSTMFVFNVEQGLPVLPEWLSFNRVTARLRQGYEIGPARLLLSASGGHVEGNFPPHEAFAIGGTNSVRGYEEGAVGSGRSYAVGSGEVSCRMFGPLEGVIFGDYGSDLGSGPKVPGDPAGARGKPGSGYGYGVGVRVDSPLGPLRLEYAFNDKQARRFHFAVGYRN